MGRQSRRENRRAEERANSWLSFPESAVQPTSDYPEQPMAPEVPAAPAGPFAQTPEHSQLATPEPPLHILGDDMKPAELRKNANGAIVVRMTRGELARRTAAALQQQQEAAALEASRDDFEFKVTRQGNQLTSTIVSSVSHAAQLHPQLTTLMGGGTPIPHSESSQPGRAPTQEELINNYLLQQRRSEIERSQVTAALTPGPSAEAEAWEQTGYGYDGGQPGYDYPGSAVAEDGAGNTSETTAVSPVVSGNGRSERTLGRKVWIATKAAVLVTAVVAPFPVLADHHMTGGAVYRQSLEQAATNPLLIPIGAGNIGIHGVERAIVSFIP